MASKAATALQHFQEKSYDAAIKNLMDIPEKSDSRVQANLLLAQFLRDGSRDSNKFLEDLQKLEAQSTDTAGSMLIMYNQSVVYFHQRQHSRAMEHLGSLFRTIDAVDDWLAVRICCLLLELCIMQRNTLYASEVLAHLEKVHSALLSAPSPATEGLKVLPVARPNIDTKELTILLHMNRARVFLLSNLSKPAKKELKTAQTLIGQPTPAILFLKANLEYVRQNYRKAIKLLSVYQKSATDNEVLSALYLNNMGGIHSRMQKHSAAAFYFSRAYRENLSVLQRPSRPLFGVSRDSQFEILLNAGLQLLLSGQPVMAFECLTKVLPTFYNCARLWLRIGECVLMTVAQQQTVLQCFPSFLGPSLLLYLLFFSDSLPSVFTQPEGWSSEMYRSIAGTGNFRRIRLSITQPSPLGIVTMSTAPVPDFKPKLSVGSAQTSDSSDPYSIARMSFRNAVVLSSAEEQQRKDESSNLHQQQQQPEQTNRLFASIVESRSVRLAAYCGLAYLDLMLGDVVLAQQDAQAALEIGELGVSFDFESSDAVAADGAGDLSIITPPTPTLVINSPLQQLPPVSPVPASTTSGSRRTSLLQSHGTPASLNDTFASSAPSDSVPEIPADLIFSAHLYMAEALVRLNRYNEAAEHLDPALFPESSDSTPTTIFGYAGVNHTTPVSPFTAKGKALQLTNLAAVMISMGNLPQAEAHIQRALQLSPTYTPALLTRAYLDLKLGNQASALRILKERRTANVEVSDLRALANAVLPPVTINL